MGGLGPPRPFQQRTVYALLHLYPPTHCAGAEVMVHTMFRALVARGHRVDVWLAPGDPSAAESYDLDGVTVHPRPALAWGTAPDWSACDVVVSHLQNVPHASRLAARHGKPFVNVLHNDRLMTRLHLHGRTSLRAYNSEWMADEIGRTSDSVIVRPPVLAEEYRTTPGTKVTLVNLNEDKGGHLFWELARRMPDVEFLAVVGAYGRQIVEDLPNVEVRPHGTDMRGAYSSSRLVLMPSVYESWGRVGVEAMASGIPVLAHPTPGLRESLGAAGTFLDRDDPDAWAQTIRHLLTDRAAWRALSRVAVARSVELDPADDLARWCAAIENLTERRNPMAEKQTHGTFTKGDQTWVAYTPAEAVNYRARGFVQVNEAAPVVLEVPPKTGKGSSREAWVAYAEQHRGDVDPDAAREDIIAAVEAATPTE
jgi:glycosyltransferase involved in cell wall biosynthesis